MSRFFTTTLAALTPYTPGEQLAVADLVKLNANENPYPPAPGVAAAVAGTVAGLRLYSDLRQTKLTEAIARRCGVPASWVLCGNGSDENLLLAIRAFCDGGTPLAFADITYSFYPVLCDLLGVPKRVVPLRGDFTLDPADYRGLGAAIVIANPNAPTSLLAPTAAVEEILQANPDRVVIVDEAYVDFAGPGASCLPLVKDHENLLVVRTFSKSRSLAGARLGFCVGQPGLIADMNRVKFSYSPYNINSMSEAAGAAAMEDEDYFRRTVAAICETRAAAAAGLRDRGWQVLDSATNFLFARPPRRPAAEILEELRRRRVLIRHFDAPRIRDWLRISIGTPAQMQRFFDALDEAEGAAPAAR